MEIDWWNDPEGRKFLRRWHKRGLPFEYNPMSIWCPSSVKSAYHWTASFGRNDKEFENNPNEFVEGIRFRIMNGKLRE